MKQTTKNQETAYPEKRCLDQERKWSTNLRIDDETFLPSNLQRKKPNRQEEERKQELEIGPAGFEDRTFLRMLRRSFCDCSLVQTSRISISKEQERKTEEFDDESTMMMPEGSKIERGVVEIGDLRHEARSISPGFLNRGGEPSSPLSLPSDLSHRSVS